MPTTTSLRRRLSQLIGSAGGNIAIIFGIALVPIITIVGIAIDYGRAANARTAMQSAADAAALMVSKDAATSSAATLQAKGLAFFKAQLNRPDIVDLTVNTVYSPSTANGGASLTMVAAGRMPNAFLAVPLLGNLKDVNLQTSSTVRWGNTRYRVALALDNTGSMASASKMTELKKAAIQLVDDFYNIARADSDVYVSVIPFAESVRIATSFRNANWLKWSGPPDYDGWEDLHGTCRFLNIFPVNRTSRTSCLQSSSYSWTPQNGPSNWTGCVMDRDKNYDTSDATPSAATPGSMVWPVDDPLCPNELLPMTSVRAQKQLLVDKINAMTPSGATNQTIGLAWAWMTHKIGDGPYPAPAKDSNYEYQDVIILLTDGENTRNRWDGDGSNHSVAVDARQQLLCANLAAAKFKVFAIQVSTASEPASAVTQNCATKPDDPTYYSNITLASQMSVKFKEIFGELSKLRIAQ